ncbi:alpha/beta fold hydrolase [Ilumatobacter sp.]|uniref:alpha/beta fold hydrolase n=1 Tax=Ilumatobacter sp. TaxID=1967498 RepID=UPI003B525BA9
MTETLTTDTLEIAYEHWQPDTPSDSAPVVLVHGFPDSPANWEPIAAALVDQGRRVLAPYLRGFGPTRFHHDATPRSGQLAALTRDLADLLDVLDIDRAVLVGQDWGARAVQGVAATQPERVEQLVSVGGYALSWDQTGGPPSYDQIQSLWYQFFLQSGWGEGMLHADPLGFSEHLWKIWSPTSTDHAEQFDNAKAALGSDDFARIVLSAYRDDPTDPRYDNLEAELGDAPTVDVATTILYGSADPLEADGPDLAADEAKFSNLIEQRVIDGAGHFLHVERPDAIVDTVLN